MTDQRDLIRELEQPFSTYAGNAAKVREVLVAGLTWEMPYWPELAVRWIEEGAPIDEEISKLLDSISEVKHFPQSLRHRAFAIARRFSRKRQNA